MVNVFRRLRARLRYRRFDGELREELSVHRAMAQDDLRSNGVADHDMRKQTARQLGNVTLARESSRQVWLAPWLESSWQDVRIGLRMILKSPQLTATALLSLAIGIGANSAVFSMLLRPMPYPDAERLVMVRAAPQDRPDRIVAPTQAEFVAWRKEAPRSFEAIGTEQEFTRDIGADEHGPAETIAAQNLTASMFEILGARAALGRVFRAEEEGFDGSGSAARVIVISDALWRRRFNGRPDVVGMDIRLDGVPTTIIGVMPPRFGFHDSRLTDAWAPRYFQRTQVVGNRVLPVLAKLRPGVTMAQAQSEMDRVAARVADTLPAQSQGWGPRLMSFEDYIYGKEADSRTLMLAAAVGFVLLIACANVAALLLTRAVSRQTEVAVRAAIGASRPRLIRQLLTESLVLGLLGAIVGMALAWVLMRTLGSFGPSPDWMERPEETVLNAQALAFTVIVSLVTSLLFGTMPAVSQSRVDLTAALNGGGKGASGTARSLRLRSGLVTAQVALAMVLLVGAGLLISGFARISSADLGADVSNVWTFRLQFSNAAFIKTIGSFSKQAPLTQVSPIPSQTFTRVQEALEAVPGIEAVGAITNPPFTGSSRRIGIRVEGYQPAAEGKNVPTEATLEYVTPRFFQTLRVPILRGRDFDARDASAGPLGIVVNEAMATEYWPNENPIGKRVQWLDVPDDRPREVIGVIRTYPPFPGETEFVPIMYALHSQQSPQSAGFFGGNRLRMTFLIRPRPGQTQAVLPAIRDVMTSIDPNKAIVDLQSLDAVVGNVLAGPRYRTTLVAVFAAAAMLLTAIGVYGLTASTVTQRTREIGIRMALGATENDVLVPVVRRAMVLIVIGLALGVTGAWFLTRSFASLYPWVTSTDVWAYVSVATIMLIVGLVACFVPAWRVIRMPPTVALRCE